MAILSSENGQNAQSPVVKEYKPDGELAQTLLQQMVDFRVREKSMRLNLALKTTAEVWKKIMQFWDGFVFYPYELMILIGGQT